MSEVESAPVLSDQEVRATFTISLPDRSGKTVNVPTKSAGQFEVGDVRVFAYGRRRRVVAITTKNGLTTISVDGLDGGRYSVPVPQEALLGFEPQKSGDKHE